MFLIIARPHSSDSHRQIEEPKTSIHIGNATNSGSAKGQLFAGGCPDLQS